MSSARLSHSRASAIVVASLLFACTSVDYRSPELPSAAASHETIAVIPVEMILSGRAPRELTAEQIERIEEAESVMFQSALYDALLDRSSTGRRRPIRIEIQPIGTTNARLEEQGIPLRESWTMEPARLAEILEVDAVLCTTVVKTRYLSDLASYGIDVGTHVIYDNTPPEYHVFVPHWLTKTHDIHIDGELCDGTDGSLLWKVVVNRETDWHRPANDVVAGLTRKLAKKFPYSG